MLEKGSETKLRYTKVKQLGNGSFGIVWLVRSNYSFKTYVLKEMNEPCRDGKDKCAAMNEANILARLKHKNVIRYKDAYFDDDRLRIIMEYCDDGDLYTKIRKQNGRKFPPVQILDWFVQLLMAVNYIHSQNVLHRDLKSQNIFLTMDGILKVGDFGISRLLECTADHARTAVGTPYYLSPEICKREPYNQKSDMWSLGVLLYEMTMLSYPFVGGNLSELVANIVVGKYEKIDSNASPLIRDLILVLLQVNPRCRPLTSDILSIPAVLTITNNFINRMKHEDGNMRKDSFSSPLIERKRDKDFKYDVVFDLTLNSSINGCTRKEIINGRVDSNDKPTVIKDGTISRTDPSDANLRSCNPDLEEVKRLNPNVLNDNTTIQEIGYVKMFAGDDASLDKNYKQLRDGEKFDVKDDDSLYNDKKLHNLEKSPPRNESYLGVSLNPCSREQQHARVAEVTLADNHCKKEEFEQSNAVHRLSHKRHCPVSEAVDGLKKPKRTANNDFIDVESHFRIESIGPGSLYSNEPETFMELVKEKTIDNCDLEMFEREKYTVDSEQTSFDFISKKYGRNVLNPYNVSRLSPQIKRKIIERARTHSLQSFQEMKKSGNMKAFQYFRSRGDSLPQFDCKDGPHSCKSSPSCPTRTPKIPHNVFEHFGDCGLSSTESQEKAIRVESELEALHRDILVFIDDDKFFSTIENKPDSFLPAKSVICSQDMFPSFQELSQTEKKRYERMTRLRSMLENKLGIEKLKMVRKFLHEKNFALLADDVLFHFQGLVGSEADNILPSIFELLMLEKRLDMTRC